MLSEAGNFRSVTDNMRESFRVIAAALAGGEVYELPGVSIAAAGVQYQLYNTAFLSAPVSTEAELGRRILSASVHFGARGLEWACWVCDDWMELPVRRRSRQIFEKFGLRHSLDLTGMVAERVRPANRLLPRMEVRRVRDRPTRDAFCAVGSVSFGVPISWFSAVFDAESVWERFAAYVGYVNQQPVSTAAVVAGGGALGVYHVATVPGHQQRGYAEVVMRQALAEMQQHSGIE